MNLRERIIQKATELTRQNPNIRWGQALYSALLEIDAKQASFLAGTTADPYYKDTQIREFWNILGC